MKGTILILGGARSGKSSYAVELAKKLSARVAFIATAACLDEEMKERIKKHKALRPRKWKVVEEGRDIASALLKLERRYEVALIDCLGLWVSNLLGQDLKDKEIIAKIERLARAASKVNLATIIVSNEVGCGIVPDNPLARRFRDLLGLANQMLAKRAKEVILMHSGIPITIKRGDGSDAEVK